MKIVTIVGARPQFIKAAVVSRAILQHNEINPGAKIREIIVHTGQHYDANMSDIFFDEMKIPSPDYNLEVKGATHGAMTGQMLEKIETVLQKENPDYVLVYGDTNSTLAGALAAKKLHMKLAHVEAGLRSFNMQMPEEINRILTDRISDILFCPTLQAVQNLNNEGFRNFNIRLEQSGDVMYDAALYYKKFSRKPESFHISSNGYVLVTIHRAENTDDPQRLGAIVSALNRISKKIKIILPVHPRTRKIFQQENIQPEFDLVDPVGYLEMVYLLENCTAVMTDSGGLQKEAYFFRKPCITLRDETEWVELLENGVNFLAGADTEKIISLFEFVTKQKIQYPEALYGDGAAGSFILEKLKNI